MLNAEQLGEALRRAFNLGQTYWRQADSDSYKQNKLADGTLNQFNDLLRDTVAAACVPEVGSDADLFVGQQCCDGFVKNGTRCKRCGTMAGDGVSASDSKTQAPKGPDHG